MSDLLSRLRAIVGYRHVLTGARKTARYRAGYRTGSGAALAVVRPGNLLEQWRVVQACVAADISIVTSCMPAYCSGPMRSKKVHKVSAFFPFAAQTTFFLIFGGSNLTWSVPLILM